MKKQKNYKKFLEMVYFLEPFLKKNDATVVGSFVLRKEGLIDRDPEDLDVITTQKESFLSGLNKFFGVAITEGYFLPPDMCGDVWSGTRSLDLVTLHGVKIHVIGVEENPSQSLLCSRVVALEHKRDALLSTSVRQKDIDDCLHIWGHSSHKIKDISDIFERYGVEIPGTGVSSILRRCLQEPEVLEGIYKNFPWEDFVEMLRQEDVWAKKYNYLPIKKSLISLLEEYRSIERLPLDI